MTALIESDPGEAGDTTTLASANAALPRRAPIIVFAAAEVIAFVTWLHVGRGDWFYIDEWDFLAGRKAGNFGDVFRPHNGHWVSLPVLAFRFVYSMFGLRAYEPYRIVIILLYLTAAALLLAVIRRAGVNPWIATAACTLFAFFGVGWENIVLPFQITFTGSFAFGLAYLLLADHDGPFERRDAFGLLAGLFALMCSAVGVVMVAVVGAAVLVRRGRRLALSHVVPLAGCYAVWLIAIGHTDSAVSQYNAADIVGFAQAGVRAAFGAIGPFAGFGIAVVIMLGVGLAFAPAQRRVSGRIDELAAPLALFVGSLGLLAVTAINRSGFGSDWARQSRYVSLVAAMMLPAIAIAADAIATRWRVFLPVAIAVFLVGIPANLHAANRAQRILRARDAATRATMLSLPLDPVALLVPRSVQPEPTTAGAVTIGWLLDAAEHHRLPKDPGSLTARLRASDDFRLSFAREPRAVPATNCRPVPRPLVLDLHTGDVLGLYDDAVVAGPAVPTLVGIGPLFGPDDDAPVTVLRDVGRVRFVPATAGATPRVCKSPGPG